MRMLGIAVLAFLAYPAAVLVFTVAPFDLTWWEILLAAWPVSALVAIGVALLAAALEDENDR